MNRVTGPEAGWIDAVHWDRDGLVPAVAQEYGSGKVLMVAWMNEEALRRTVAEQRAIYWSRSRAALWRKGDESGHVQRLREIRLDCDGDVILLTVEQIGGVACHTGRHSCFFRRLRGDHWEEVEAVIEPPDPVSPAK